MKSQKSLKRLSLQENSSVYLLSEYNDQGKLFLKILNFSDFKAYVGEVSNTDLRVQAASIRLTLKDFLDKACQALFKNKSEHSQFRYILESGNAEYSFKWKSVDSEGTSVQLGTVSMKRVDYNNSLTEMLLSVSEEMDTLNTNISDLKSKLEVNKEQTEEAIQNLTMAVKTKEMLEKEMYAKFVLVLNEKKRKIRELRGLSEDKKSFVKKQKAVNIKKRSHVLSDSSDDADGNFDAGPSTSRRDSLAFLDEEKPVTSATQSKIRNRKIHYSKACREDNIKSKAIETVANVVEDSDGSDELLFHM